MRITFDLTLLLTTAALVLRLSVLMATLPLLDLRAVPLLWRLALAAALAAALAPTVAPLVPPGTALLAWPTLVGEALRSLVVGALLAFAVNLAFTAVRYAGTIMDMQIGFGIVNTFDPQTGSQISVISQLYYLLAVLLFFSVDAHHVMLREVVASCRVLPPFAPLSVGAGGWQMVEEYGSVFGLGLRLAAPLVTVLLLISAAMGVIVKTAPQIHVLVVGFPIKIGVGLLVIGLSLVYFKNGVLGLFAGGEALVERVLLALTAQ